MKSKVNKKQSSSKLSNNLYKQLGLVSFYDKMPSINKPIIIIHNQSEEVYEAIRTENGLFVNGNRVSGCYYSWVYSSKLINNTTQP